MFETRILFDGRPFKTPGQALRFYENRLRKGLKEVPPRVFYSEVTQQLTEVRDQLKTVHSFRWPGGTTPTTLSVRTGEGIRSMRVSGGYGNRDAIGTLTIGFPFSVHEDGATIRPKRAQYLTIPLKAALTHQGVPIKRSARQWKNTFVFRSKAGNLIIAQKRGRKGFVPLYVLKKKVKIPPRLGATKRLFHEIPFFESRLMDRIIREIGI